VIWQGNTKIGDNLTLEQYMDMGHVSVGFGRSRHLSIEEWFMNQYGFNRRIEVITNDFNTLPQLVVGTQRIATMHQRLARLYAEHLPLRILNPPVKIPVMRERISEFIQHVERDHIAARDTSHPESRLAN